VSVKDPQTVQDQLDKIANFARAKANLDELGLLDDAVSAVLDRAQQQLHATIAGEIKFPPGSKVKLVKSTDGTLLAYDEAGGLPNYEVPDIIDAAAIPLVTTPATTSVAAPA
jgi:hypothetical protein